MSPYFGSTLIGNTLPMSLPYTRPFTVVPIPHDEAQQLWRESRVLRSFWGHESTRAHAERMLGDDEGAGTLLPRDANGVPIERPAITLVNGWPTLGGVGAETVLVLSPVYRTGFRPAVGSEVKEEDIADWQCLRADFIGDDGTSPAIAWSQRPPLRDSPVPTPNPKEQGMHSKPVADSDGVFSPPKEEPKIKCRKCGAHTVSVKEWESSCGGYTDYRCACACGHVWWIEGPDA